VDDLERSPERTLEVLDILESLFSIPSCVVVIPTDLEVLADALEQYSKVKNGRKYLEKYVQLQFDMPSVENSRLLGLLVKDAGGPATVYGPPMALGSHTIAQARDHIDEQIRKQGVTRFVNNSSLVVPATEWNQLVDERRQRALPETAIYQEALAFAVSLAGRDVRAAKRISNHVRLYCFVLFQRGLFHSTSVLQARHVGRWIAMRELWPEIAAAVSRNPPLLDVLDRWADDTTADDLLKSLGGFAGSAEYAHWGDVVGVIAAWSTAKMEALRKFLRSDPKLTTVVGDLCYLRREPPLGSS
jgi:hypothetical protein